MADNNGKIGQQFVVDILTRYRDTGLKQAQEAQTKLKEVLAATTGTFDNSRKAAGGYGVSLKTLANELNQFNKTSWQGVAIGNTVSKAFTGIAEWAMQATAKVAAFSEELYYMNRRLSGPGTAGLFNFAFAAQQIGLSPEQGLGAIENMGAAVRTNPGLAALLGRFLPGYKPGGAVGSQEMLGLVNRFKGQFGENGYFIASQLAGEFGVGEHEFRQMWTNVEELNAQYKKHGEILKEFGVDTNATSKSFTEFHRALNEVTTIFDAMFQKFGGWLAENVGIPAAKEAARVLRGNPNVPGLWDIASNLFSGIGTLYPSSGAPNAGSTGGSRERFAQELAANPALREKIMAISAGENLNQSANLGVIESMMNRASMMGTSLAFEARRTGEGGYYAGYNAEALNDPTKRAMIENNLRLALGGSNISNYATDNASGAWGAARMAGMYTQTFGAGGEMFGYPSGPDARGAAQYAAWRAGQVANSSPSGNAPTYDVDHNVTVNIHGNADMGVMKDAASLLGKDSVWEQQMRQMVRGDNFR
jgi:hypothetical protein